MEIFSKLLLWADVNQGLAIPFHILSDFKDLNLRVTDWTGQVWNFHLYIWHGSLTLCLCDDWLEFARAKDLQVGDLLIFSLLEDGQYKVMRLHGDEAARYLKMKANRRKMMIFERIFIVTNFVLEVPSAILDQLSSQHKAQYVLTAMLISFAILLVCIGELVYSGRQAGVASRWRQKHPWLYYPSSGYKLFGNFTDVVGLLSAILQCIFTTIAYILFCRGINNPIQISVMPLIFAFCLLCSKFRKNSVNIAESKRLQMV